MRDKLGEDRLFFGNFGLNNVTQDWAVTRVERHFACNEFSIEWLVTEGGQYRISNDVAFTNGPVETLLSDCILHTDGFEDVTPPAPDLPDSCDIGDGIWAVEARDCTVDDCVNYEQARYRSWEGKIWCRALITQESSGWMIGIYEGVTAVDFWQDRGTWDLNN